MLTRVLYDSLDPVKGAALARLITQISKDVQQPDLSQLSLMPLGFHLVYVPAPNKLADLSPDGYDKWTAPNGKFFQRLWQRGNISFRAPLKWNTPIECIETIQFSIAQDGNILGNLMRENQSKR